MRWLIKKYMAQQHIESYDELANETGIQARTIYNRLNDPRKLRAFEIDALDSVLHFADEDLLKLVKGNL
jgi:hypothetical protein